MASVTNKDFHSPQKLGNCLVLATLVVIAGHAAGSIWLYRATDWFDNLLHFAGGAWLALAVIFSFRGVISSLKTFLIVFGAALILEIFEGGLNLYAKNAYGFATPVGGATGDTILDIILGILGTLITLSYIKTKKQ